MCPYWSRRDVLKGLVAASATWIQPATGQAVREPSSSASVEIEVTPITSLTFRLSILQGENGSAVSIPSDGSLSQASWGAPVARLRSDPSRQIEAGISRLTITFHPVTVLVKNDKDKIVQRLVWDEKSASLSFLIGDSPVLGLGEGGPQFDRRG